MRKHRQLRGDAPGHHEPLALAAAWKLLDTFRRLAMRRCLMFATIVAPLWASLPAQSAPAKSPGYPVIPVPLPDAAEIVLARSAAPPDVSDSADIYVVRAGRIAKLHAGTSGSACFVARDLHEGSAYPICFNPEGARTAMQRELLQNRLRSLGIAEDSIDRVVASEFEKGTLKAPARLAVAYMMSPQQVLFSSPKASGRRVGPWHPHLMFYTPHTSERDLGISGALTGDGVISVGDPGTHHTEVVVKVPRWSNGTASP